MKKFLSTLLTLSMVLTMLATGAAIAASDEVQADADALTLDDILSVPSWNGNTLIDNLDIDIYTKGEVNESPVVWSSTNEAVISTSGIVTRGTEDAEVIVTATIGTDDDVVTKDFTFVVPAASKSINGMPNVSSVKFEDTFSDNEINASKFTYNVPASTDSVVEENGKMTLNRSTWTSGEPNIEFSHEFNGNLITTAEFTLSSTSSYLRIPFIGYNWNGYPLYIHWYPKNNNISIGKYGVENDSIAEGRISLPASAKDGKAKFTVMVNAPKKTYSIWVNNEIVIANNPYMESNAQKPYKIRFMTVSTSWMYGVGATSIDNFKIYESTQNDAHKAFINVDNNINSAATYTNVNQKYLIDNLLVLESATGVSGATASYTISDPSVISETGKVTRALNDKNVSVTATVTTANGDTLNKTYKYIVPGKYNRLSNSTLPLIDKDYPVTYTSTPNQAGVTDSSILTAYSDDNGKISFTSAYASNKEPGFTYKYSDNLKGDFVQNFVFSSNSNAMRARVSDSAFNRKLDIYYLDNKTLTISGTSTATHANTFTGKTVKLTLVYSMSAGTVDVYLNGELWLDDFALVSGGHANIQHIMVSHHCATIMGAWRGGQGTTTFYSLNAYKIVDESTISDIMATDVIYSNEGTVSAGENIATATIVAGNEAGERGGKFVYAVYSVESGVKKLVGVDVVSLGLDEFSHKEYNAKITLDSVPANAQQATYIWGDSGLIPLTTQPFPAQ